VSPWTTATRHATHDYCFSEFMNAAAAAAAAAAALFFTAQISLHQQTDQEQHRSFAMDNCMVLSSSSGG